MAMAVGVAGSPLTPDQAIARAMNERNVIKYSPALTHMPSPRLEYTLTDSISGAPAVYVFSSAGTPGYLVVSADDAAVALLGYSDSGRFDASDIPPAMQAWMDGYAREIAGASDSPYAPVVKANTTDYGVIEPMVTSKWNQSAPYNDRCPLYNGLKSVTGCLATAEAQVLNYHKYPAAGSGVVTYNWKAANRSISVDLDTVPLAWTEMLDSYTDTSTPSSKLAVANLMYACGVVSSMNYTNSSSGATSLAGAQGLYAYMGCSEASITLRSWFNPDQWEEYVYNYLSEKGPLVYCGQSTAGGHAFVCDGYRSDGYFHFNWGWGGMSDGYFRLSALNPGSQGIGGSSSGYNSDQQLITGMYKPGTKGKFVPMVAADGGVYVNPDFNCIKGDTILLESPIDKCGFFNYSIDTISVTYGAHLIHNATNESTYVECYGIQDVDLPGLRGWRSYPIITPENLKEGTYTLTPAFKTDGGTWHDMPILQSSDTYVLMTVEADSVKFGRPQPAPIKISDIKLETPLYSGSNFKVKANITATSDRKFYGNVAILLGELIDGEFVSDFQGEALLLSASPQENDEFTYTALLGNKRLKGDYTLVFINTDNYQIISEPISVNIKPYVAPAYEVSDAVIINASAVNPNDVKTAFKLKCTAGFFTKTITLAVGKLGNDGVFSLISRFESPTFYVEQGETSAFEFGGGFAGEPGQIYDARLEIYNPETRKFVALTDYMQFKVGGSSGIENVVLDSSRVIITPNPVDDEAKVISDGPIKSIEAYDAGGAAVSVDIKIADSTATIYAASLRPGLYLINVATETGNTVAKFVKR